VSPGWSLRALASGYHWLFPSLSFRVELTGHCAEGGGSEVLYAGQAWLVREDPKWLGQLRRKAATVPYGAGAWGR